MINLSERERLHIVACWDNIMNLIEHRNEDESLEKLRGIMPVYQLEISYRVHGSNSYRKESRFFTYSDNKKKGKKRIYASETRGHTIHIRYLSSQTVRQLCGGERSDVQYWAHLVLSDRWIIVADLVKFKSIYQLVNHLVAVERTSSRSNHPVEGRTTWTGAEVIIRDASRFRSIRPNYHIYGVNLRRYLWR